MEVICQCSHRFIDNISYRDPAIANCNFLDGPNIQGSVVIFYPLLRLWKNFKKIILKSSLGKNKRDMFQIKFLRIRFKNHLLIPGDIKRCIRIYF